MPLTPGNVVIAPDGSATGSGVAKALYDALEAEYDAEPSNTPGNVPGAQESLAKMARGIGIPLAEEINENAGPGGSSAYTETFAAAASWVVNHNLGRHPYSWAVETLGGLEIEVAVQHVTANQSIVSFDTPVAGVVRFT